MRQIRYRDTRDDMGNDWLAFARSTSPSEENVDPREAEKILRVKMQDVETQRQRMESKVSALKSGRRAVASILAEKCAGCGLCTDVCLNSAIRIDRHAIVDPWLCSACAACVSECPNGAVIIVQQKFRC